MSNVVIIGAGNVGGPLGRRAEQANHQVTTLTSSTDTERASTSLAAADLVVLALPYQAALELPGEWVDALAGKVVIDATNPLTPDFTALTVGYTTSGGEQVAEHLSSARVVKALNGVLAPNHDPATFPDGSVFVPIAGDDGDAVQITSAFVSSLGFDAVPAGPLANARYIEPLTELLIQLAYVQGVGTAICLKLQRG
ncbi:NADPH-dependent F420 reductase [Micropruina sp.]|uniref:NADPH-dependent F420 reductase n=1 Tax=Micropruina sp. TaxID=2737536 RepID=UPI0039E49665